jgi:NADPH2:quinone reductase
MKTAVRIEMTRYGGPEVLRAVTAREVAPAPGEVIVAVEAAAVNRADCEIRSGKWPIQRESPFPYVPGLELVGRVSARGERTSLAVGTPVITMMQELGGIHGVRPGGYQSLAAVPESTLARLPTDIELRSLAALGLAGVTAFHGVAALDVKAGQRILIQGLPGGVAICAVSIVRARGGVVVGTTRRSEKTETLRSLGVDEIWDLEKNDWSHYLSQKVDACLEMVGGAVFGHCVSALKPGGRLCSIGALTGGPAEFSIWDLLHERHLTGWSSENLTRDGLQRAVDELAQLLRSGKIAVPPHETLALADAARAHAAMESGALVGRLLLIP